VDSPLICTRDSGDLEAEATGGPGLLTAGTQTTQALDQHGISRQGFGAIDQRIENLVVAGCRHVEQLLDGFFLRAGVLPPLALEGEHLLVALGEPVGTGGAAGLRELTDDDRDAHRGHHRHLRPVRA